MTTFPSVRRATLAPFLLAVLFAEHSAAQTETQPVANWPVADVIPASASTLAETEAGPTADAAQVAETEIPPVPPAEKQDDWKFFFAAYGWLTGVEGTVVDGGNETELDVPFEVFADNTTAGFQGYAEVRWKKWFAAFDGTWASLGNKSDGVLLDLDVGINQEIFDVHIGRELLRTALDPAPHAETGFVREQVVDAFVGLRYFGTSGNVTLTPIVGTPTVFPIEDTRTDPFIGMRWGRDLTRFWSVGARGDIGGFGIGDAAQFTWQLSATVGARITNSTRLFVGYRALAYDTVTGSGVDRAGQDFLQHGPVIGFGVAL